MEINSNFIPPKYLTDPSVVAKLTTMLELEQPGSNIDFILSTDFKKIDYDETPITNFGGNLIVKDEVLTFRDNSLEVLSGKIKMDGYYSTQDKKHPKIHKFYRMPGNLGITVVEL